MEKWVAKGQITHVEKLEPKEASLRVLATNKCSRTNFPRINFPAPMPQQKDDLISSWKHLGSQWATHVDAFVGADVASPKALQLGMSIFPCMKTLRSQKLRNHSDNKFVKWHHYAAHNVLLSVAGFCSPLWQPKKPNPKKHRPWTRVIKNEKAVVSKIQNPDSET